MKQGAFLLQAYQRSTSRNTYCLETFYSEHMNIRASRGPLAIRKTMVKAYV